MKRDYKVSLTVTSVHEYVIPECNSPEEAETIAETYFADGEEGSVMATDIEMFDTVVDDGSGE